MENHKKANLFLAHGSTRFLLKGQGEEEEEEEEGQEVTISLQEETMNVKINREDDDDDTVEAHQRGSWISRITIIPMGPHFHIHEGSQTLTGRTVRIKVFL